MKKQVTLTLLPIGLVILFLTFGHMSIAAPGSLDPVLAPVAAEQSISSVLNSNGTIKRGISDNFDPNGFRTATVPNGQPRFDAKRESSKNASPPATERSDNSSFSAGLGPNGGVFAIAVSGNDVYVGGSFYIAKWDGSNWSPLGSGMNGDVNALAVSGTGDLYAGGSFTTAGGVAANRIAKWNGSSWSPVGSGFNGPVWALAISGSNIYASGEFTTAGGASANRIAKWNGASWSSVGWGMNGPVWDIAVSGNIVYAGGDFTTAGGPDTAFSIARWNIFGWSPLSWGINGSVRAIVISGGNVYAGGYFTHAGGLSAHNLARWNGSAWSAIPGAGAIAGPPRFVSAMAMSQDGKLYIGGNLDIGPNIAVWNGSTLSGVGSGIGTFPNGGTFFPNGSVKALAISASGTVYAGGFFSTAGGKPANNIARWNGTAWSDLVRTTVPSQAANITFANVRPYHMDVSWTNGNGHGRVVKINTENSFTAPADSTDPSADSTYGGSGEQVVYNGSGSSITVTGLSPNTTYYFHVYEYNNYGPYTLFNTGTATNNPNSRTTIHCTAAITVTTTNDSGVGSLRQATTDICSGGTIDFDPSVFATPQTITLTSGQLVIDKNLTIQGPGAGLLFISGNASRVFFINSGVTTTLDRMTIRNGFSDYGAGIVNQGTLTVSNSTIFGNYVYECQDFGCASTGGGIYNSVGATLTVTNGTISGNATAEYGGGISNGGTLTVNNSTIAGNTTGSGNSSGDGGGIFNYGTMTINNSTISGNTARNGGGIYLFDGTETLVNTIVSGNAGLDVPDIYGQIGIASHNLIGDAGSSGGIVNGVNGNIVGVNPLLGPLQNNGGPTMTHALRPGSPAINAGDNCVLTANGCGDGNPALPTDQRGFGRVGPVDIGAFERQDNESSSTTSFDYDGDDSADLSVFRPADGNWWITLPGGGFQTQSWGETTDRIAPADYDGDGKTDIAVYRPSDGNWWVMNSLTSTYSVQAWGDANDVIVPGDYTGDGKADHAVWRPSDGNWWIRDSSNGQYTITPWGVSTDKPVPADYDGDGTFDLMVFRPSEGSWYLRLPGGGTAVTNWGTATDKLVPADYTGDGKADFAVWRPATGTWWILDTSNGQYQAINWGAEGDLPVPADYDGNGETNIAVWRPADGVWWILNDSGGGYSTTHWGANGDIPTPNAYVR